MPDTIKKAKALVKLYMAKDIPTYVSGPPGVGKSDLYRQLADEGFVDDNGKKQSLGFIDLRLGMMDPVDLLGLPSNVVNSKTGINETQWARPAYWPNVERDGQRGIILFDELTDCSRAMQSVTYQIILNRRAGPHVIPRGWYPAAAGNRREDKAAAQALSTALANRFAHIDVFADPESWHEWAMRETTYMGHLVPAFIKVRPDLLHNMKGGDLRAFPTPRSWAQVAKVVEDCPPEYRRNVVSGLVGDGAAAEFEAFMKALKLPAFDDIIADPAKCFIPQEPANKYALCCMLARYAKRANFSKIMTYIKRESFGKDYEICTVLDATKREGALCDTPAYLEFANRHADMML